MSGTLDPAMATRLEKVAVDNGFDREHPRDGAWLAFASTQAPLRLWLTALDDRLVAGFSMAHVDASLSDYGVPCQVTLPAAAVAARSVTRLVELHHLVRRAFQLSRTLPDALLDAFTAQTAKLPRTTESERLVIERVGQGLFRNGLLEYWQGRCAVTGLAVPEVLRASHIKPWAACHSDNERLDVFNGLLLSPNLDAAFDCGLITVREDGAVLVSDDLPVGERKTLGIDGPLRVTALSPRHATYLDYHRTHVYRTRPAATAVGTRFQRYIGIDYSGAETPVDGLTGIRVYVATPTMAPLEERPTRGQWSRRTLAEWLVGQLSEAVPTIVGIDHAFSFPLQYFERHSLPHRWPAFVDDFRQYWPTHQEHVWVRDLRNDPNSTASARRGETTWRRLTEQRAGAAKSVFHFGVQGEVATSSHAGLPWLAYIRDRLADSLHFWPFDGWNIPSGRSSIVEVYPSLWRAAFLKEGVNGHQQDAYAVAAWLRESDGNGSLTSFLNPGLTTEERMVAAAEGWILGVA